MGILDIAYGSVIGLSLGLTGAGGSIITIPILIYLLGMNAHVATGTSLVIVGVGALAGAIQYAFGKTKYLHWRIGFLFAAAAQLYLLMYILMFISAMTLRVKKPDVKRTYRVPAMNFIAIVGLVASALAFALGFISPSELKGVPLVAYPLIVLAITFGLFIIPIIIYAVRKPEWKTVSDEEFAELIGAHATPPSKHAPTPKTKQKDNKKGD